VCDPRAHVPTPVGAVCAGHDHMHDRNRSALIQPEDQGVTMPFSAGVAWERTARRVAYHLTCWLHEVGADVIDNERTT
jgi:hypothetical protein